MKQILFTYLTMLGSALVMVKLGKWIFDLSLWWLYIVALVAATAMQVKSNNK